MTYQKYNKYKESWVGWIWKIPEEWDIRRLKDAYSSTNAWEVIDKWFWNTWNELLYTCQKTPMASDFSTFPKWKRTTKHDLLLTRNATPYIFIPFENAIYSNVVQRIVMHNKFDKRFVKRALECWVNAEQVNGDTIPSWNMQVWNNISFAFPSLPEQERICNYLDEKTNNIDKRIELLQQKSEKYKTLRKNLISHIVTHGLNSDVKMKDSWIEWLGKIPEHWEVRRIKDVFTNGKWLWITKADLVEQWLPVISYWQVHAKYNSGTALTDKLFRFVPTSFSKWNDKSLVNKWDFIFADTSEDIEWCWDAVYVDRDIVLYAGYHSIILRLRKLFDSKYFAYLFKSDAWRHQIRWVVCWVKLYSITLKIINTKKITIPPVKEQKEITKYLDTKTSQIDKILLKIDEEIEKLKELRKVLINDVVTGKIKVI